MSLFPPDALATPNASATDQQLGPGAWVLRGYALDDVDGLLAELGRIRRQSPFRHMVTPGGYTMSVGLTCCGTVGWTADHKGYRYAAIDPETGQPWPAMPHLFLALAQQAASHCGYAGFTPDSCLINRYVPGARLSLHQDKDETDFSAPIVSVSLGMPAMFQFGGLKRSDRPEKVPLFHGDIVVWGGPDRLRYHGVLALKDDPHPLLGANRINLTFRKTR
nr:DNA oxidative demethylase AlkB [Advenella mimigardefordensis]